MHRAGKYTFDLSFLEYRIVRLRRSRFIAKVVSGISLLREREKERERERESWTDTSTIIRASFIFFYDTTVLISFVLFFFLLPEYDPETNEALLYFTDSFRSNAYGALVE